MLTEGMACCHAITYVHNELVGDPLEIKMFEMTGWTLEEDHKGSNSLAQLDEMVLANVRSPTNDCLVIVKRFDFESKLQRMSVVVKRLSDMKYTAFVKGSPEMIKKLSRPDTVPAEFDQAMNEYTV